MAEIKQPKILVLDLETFPLISYTWGRYDQNVIKVLQETCIATFAAKWLGDSKVISKSLPDYKGYKAGSYNDEGLVKDLWKLLDEADAAIAHNGDDFDFKVCNARFIFYKLTPPSPYKTVDTKKVATRAARFSSNKLDDLGQLLGMGKKIKTDFDLWNGCINGDPKSWKKMVEYNEQDVLLLEQLYLRLLPWVDNHPNFTEGAIACPKCGSHNVHWRGIQRAITRSYRRFQCQKCGGWGRAVKSEKFSGASTQNIGK